MKRVFYLIVIAFCLSPLLLLVKTNSVRPESEVKGSRNIASVKEKTLTCDTDVPNWNQLARLDSNGRLKYGTYSNIGQSRKINILPDFSFAGYKGGGVRLPKKKDVPNRVTLKPRAGDDLARIKKAIQKVSRMKPDKKGFRGAVLLKKGLYHVSAPIKIKKSGVVLRGEGAKENGTVVVGTARNKNSVIILTGKTEKAKILGNTEVEITDYYVPVGANSVKVEDASDFKVKDYILITKKPNKRWVGSIGMDELEEFSQSLKKSERSEKPVENWDPSDFEMSQERKIVDIKNNTIFFDIPLVDSIQSELGGGTVVRFKPNGRLSNVGVEHMRILSAYKSRKDEDHSHYAVEMRWVKNSWLKNVVGKNFYGGVIKIDEKSNFNTIEDCASLSPISKVIGQRRYAFRVNSGTGNLFQRNYSSESRHNFVTNSRVTGPNVWLDSLAESSYRDDGPHARYATGLLFDNLKGSALRVQNRMTEGSGQGWSGTQVMFWNSIYETMISDAPQGAMNWIVGGKAKLLPGMFVDESPGICQFLGEIVEPRSLYLQQLKDRKGEQAVRNIAKAVQQKGQIFDFLEKKTRPGNIWHSRPVDPTCARGIRSGNGKGKACCPRSCNACGANQCTKGSKKASRCCSDIVRKATSCLKSEAPCRLPNGI